MQCVHQIFQRWDKEFQGKKILTKKKIGERKTGKKNSLQKKNWKRGRERSRQWDCRRERSRKVSVSGCGSGSGGGGGWWWQSMQLEEEEEERWRQGGGVRRNGISQVALRSSTFGQFTQNQDFTSFIILSALNWLSNKVSSKIDEKCILCWLGW